MSELGPKCGTGCPFPARRQRAQLRHLRSTGRSPHRRVVFGGAFPLYIEVVNLDRGITCGDCDPTIKLHLMRIDMHSVGIAQAWRRAKDPDQRQCDCRYSPVGN
jgi:hypothetical protein